MLIAIHVEQPTAAALLQRMDGGGLIEKSPDPHDRRVTRISLSAHAHEVMPAALELLGHVNAEATAGLSTAEIKRLHDLLRRVLTNLVTMADDRGQAVSDARRRRGPA